MKVRYVPELDVGMALDADGALWGKAASETVKLMPTPVGLQPTDAIRTTWITKKIGLVESVSVAALHDGSRVAFRLEWADATEDRAVGDTTEFPDAAGILLPSVPGAVSVTMGAPGLPVNAWYWRADEEGQGRQVVAEGLGTTRPAAPELVQTRGVWRDGRWRVVLSRALQVKTSEPLAQLSPGEVTGFGVAIWEGHNGERAGIKSFSGDWLELALAALPTARR